MILGFTLYVSESNRYDPRNPPPGKPDVAAGELSFYRGLANQDLPGDLPMQVIWMAGIAVLFWFALRRSLFGFRLKAVGGNPVAARLAGLPVRRYKWFAFLLVSASAADCCAARLLLRGVGRPGLRVEPVVSRRSPP